MQSKLALALMVGVANMDVETKPGVHAMTVIKNHRRQVNRSADHLQILGVICAGDETAQTAGHGILTDVQCSHVACVYVIDAFVVPCILLTSREALLCAFTYALVTNSSANSTVLNAQEVKHTV